MTNSIQPGRKPEPVAPVQRVRASLLVSSLLALREKGHFDRYSASLPAAERTEILALLPGDWASIELVSAHYRACNALDLLSDEATQMGQHVGSRLQGPFMDILTKTVRGSGVTPWALLDQLYRFWERVMVGGGVVASRKGPKDAHIRAEGFPPFEYDYCRYAYAGMFSLGFQLAGAKSLRLHTGPYEPSTMSCTYRAAWV